MGDLQKSSKSLHPLHQIAESPTHKLLLKQWLKEEELILRRITLKESQIDSVRREIAFLYCTFFAIHAILLLLLLPSASPESCHRFWVPCLTSFGVSMATIWALRYKTDSETHAEKLLEREREDAMLLNKCVDELKRKGLEFDLLKEVDALRRAKCLRVEARGGASAAAGNTVRKWSAKDFGVLVMFGFSCAFLGFTRFLLCH